MIWWIMYFAKHCMIRRHLILTFQTGDTHKKVPCHIQDFPILKKRKPNKIYINTMHTI